MSWWGWLIAGVIVYYFCFVVIGEIRWRRHIKNDPYGILGAGSEELDILLEYLHSMMDAKPETERLTDAKWMLEDGRYKRADIVAIYGEDITRKAEEALSCKWPSQRS